MKRPARLTFNAWAGEEGPVTADLVPDPGPWIRGEAAAPEGERIPKFLAPEIDQRKWRDEKVGWGLIVRNREEFTRAQKLDHADMPEPLRGLLRDRAPAPVFHFFPNDPDSHGLLHHFNAKKDEDLSVEGSEFGLGPGRLPYYLLIYGSPSEVPWTLQYILNTSRAVGRLDLEGDDLDHYVTALRAGWPDATARADNTLVWAVVDPRENDITGLLRDAIAAVVHGDLADDPDIKQARFLDGAKAPALAAGLIEALARDNPALIVTTSHGRTALLNDPDGLRAELGLPVGHDHQALRPDDLLDAWQPGGAIWYAHACCSAGTDSESSFQGLVVPGSTADRMFRGLAGLGARVAPLPKKLLGAKNPLRAFIGHVEPTCDFTLLKQETGQFLTEGIRTALHQNLFQTNRWTVGMAFRGWYRRTNALQTQLGVAGRGPAHARPTEDTLFRSRMKVNDIRSLVILGDPTVMIPPTPRGGGKPALQPGG